MANDNNSEQLSDKDLEMDTAGLAEVCSSWNSAVVSADLGSMDVSGAFSPLTQNGVAVGYVTSLKNALQKSEKLALSVNNLISTTALEQEEADQNGENASNNRKYSSGGGSSYYGGASNNTNTGSYEETNKVEEKPEVNSDNETEQATLSEEEEIEIITDFLSIYDGNLYDYLCDTSNATKVKEILLNSPNLSADLKAKIATMDENEIQTYLKNVYVSGQTISDFSKIIVTIYDNDLKNNFQNSTVYDSSESIASVYSFLSKQPNYQQQLKELYYGSSQVDKVDEQVINFTRNFIDTLATASNVSYEDILNNSEYGDTLKGEIKDLANTFSILNVANKSSETDASKLYSNIIIKSS